MKFLTLFFITIVVGSFLFVSIARAVNVDVKFLETPDSEAGKSANDIADFIATFYKFALGIAGIVAVGMITAGAIFYSVSGESPQAQSEGKDMIISALWGVTLLLGSYLILNTINPRLVALKEPGIKQTTGYASCVATKIENDIPYTADSKPIETYSDGENKDANAKKCGDEETPLDPLTDEHCKCYKYEPPPVKCSITKDQCPQKLILVEDLPRGQAVVKAVKPGEAPQDFKEYADILAGVAAGDPYSKYYAEEEEIWKYSKIWLYPYYIKDDGPTSAKCLIYARKEPDTALLPTPHNSCADKQDYTLCEYDDPVRISLQKQLKRCQL